MTQDPLSDPVVTLAGMTRWHPWRALREQPDIDQVWEAEPDRLSSWCERSRTLRINPNLTQAERRCSVAHELIHAERGDVGECDDRVEAIVHREAARRLMPISDVLDAIAYYGEDWPRVAAELWVDEETLEVRLLSAHPSEKGAIRRCLAMREESA